MRTLLVMILLLVIGCSHSNELHIVYSSDIWGETSHCGCPGHPTGGLPKKASFLKEIRNKYKGVYYFEIGDTFFRPQIDINTARSEIPKVDMFIDFFNRERLDVFVPGEADFLLGIDFLKERLKSAKFKTVLSNLVEKESKKTVFNKIYVDKRYKTKVCLFALISPEFFKDDSYEVLEPVSVAKEILSEFERTGCQFNILLSHLGYNMDITFLRAIKNSNLNILIGSHDGGWMDSPRKDENVLTVYGYRRGQAVGHIGFVGSLNTKTMKDVTDSIKEVETLSKLNKELKRLIAPAKNKDPEEFFKNDSNTLMRIRMIKERIAELEIEVKGWNTPPYYFNRVVAMDTAYEDDKEVERLIMEVEKRIKR